MLAGLAAFLLLAGLVLVTSTLLGRGSRPLYPNLPTFTPLSETLESKPTVLTFTELNADPDAYRDRRIQVAGNYASVSPPTCAPFSGPAIHWTLVADELQLNAVGFENILRLLAERGWDRSPWKMFAAMILGVAVVYVPGLAWLAAWTGSIATAVQYGLVPFIAGDLVKAAIAALGFPAVWALLGRR